MFIPVRIFCHPWPDPTTIKKERENSIKLNMKTFFEQVPVPVLKNIRLVDKEFKYFFRKNCYQALRGCRLEAIAYTLFCRQKINFFARYLIGLGVIENTWTRLGCIHINADQIIVYHVADVADDWTCIMRRHKTVHGQTDICHSTHQILSGGTGLNYLFPCKEI